MNKKRILISIIIIVIISLVLVIGIGITKEKKEINNNIDSIKKSYNLLTSSITKYNDIRSNYIDKTSILILENYMDSHDDIVNILEEYDKVIKDIDSYISNIKFRCTHLYNDNEVNNICNNYQSLYEKVINLYITDIDNYNDLVKKYNEYSKKEIALHEKIHKDYIDYNNDKVFDGVGDSHEE